VIELNGGTEISLDELTAKSASTNKKIEIGQKIGETTSKIVKWWTRQQNMKSIRRPVWRR